MMAKPAVEPRARWALMMPEAMPERSGGIDAIATFVVGATASPPAHPQSSRPSSTTGSEPPMPAATTPRPSTNSVMPASVGRRPPERPARPPEMGARMIVGTVKASIRQPASSGL